MGTAFPVIGSPEGRGQELSSHHRVFTSPRREQMRLDLATTTVGEVRFAGATRFADGGLEIDRDELRAMIPETRVRRRRVDPCVPASRYG